jgi:hypothetical protein
MRVNWVHAVLFWAIGAGTFWAWSNYVAPRLGGSRG